MHRTPVMRFFVSTVFLCNAIYANPILRFMSWVVCFHWNVENVEPNANYSRFRWLVQLEVVLVALEPEEMAIHLHHRALRRSWLLRPRSCGSWCKPSSNREVGIMLINREVSYHDFLSTQPPLFTKADEPLDADAWICTIESKFSLLSVPWSEANKTRYAA